MYGAVSSSLNINLFLVNRMCGLSVQNNVLCETWSNAFKKTHTLYYIQEVF